jgi:hypothetical protein
LLKTRKFPDFLTRKKPLQKRKSITFPSAIKENKTNQKKSTKHTKKASR